jgi:hypothetical protein
MGSELGETSINIGATAEKNHGVARYFQIAILFTASMR